MTKLYQKLALAALAAVAFTLGAKAQTAFYTQTFAGGIPTTWTATPAPVAGVGGWVWENRALHASNPDTYKIDTLASTTRANGWALYDSSRDCSGTQDAKLISPVINCTGKTTVVIEFQEWYRKFSDSTALMVSRDGGATWTYFRIKENVCTINQYCSTDPTGHTAGNNPTTVQINVSSVAANQANVKFGFRFVSNAGTGTAQSAGGCAYQWKVDDVRVLDGLVTYASNYKVRFPFRPDSWMTPSTQLSPLTWAVQAVNLGTQARTGVSSTVTINKTGVTTPVFTNTRSTPWGGTGTISLGAGGSGTDTLTILHGQTFTPPTTPTFYQFKYDLAADAPSQFPDNATYSNFFGVSDNLFLKTAWDPTTNEPNVASATSTGAAGDKLEWGIVYDVINNTDASGNRLLATGVTYALAKSAASGAFANEAITATLSKWVDANNDNAIDFATEMVAVGLGTETIPASYTNFGIRTLALDDLGTGNAGVALEANTKYFIAIEAPIPVLIAYDNQINDNDYVGVVTQGLHTTTAAGVSTWFSGFSGGQMPVVGLYLAPVTATEKTKSTNFNVSVFPNPTSELVTMTASFEKTTNAVYEVTDLAGKVIFTESHKNVTNDTFKYDVRALAAGAYNIVLRTEAGVQSSRFTVAK